jgi:hypothetical protein
MTDEIKFILALQQIDNLTSLLKDNEYEQYMYYHLIQVQVEVQRQLTNLSNPIKIKES